MNTTTVISKTGELKSTSIHWKQLWSLAALYASIIIGWIAYRDYQPKLLRQFGFNDYAFFLAITQAIILVLTPPIAGIMGDRFRFEKGHRLPVISSGVSFAAMIFMAVAFTLFTNPGEFLKWILPVLIVFWLIGMSIFTSPALSTVELFTPIDKLPKAMALLTIVSSVIYAIEPIVVDIIDYLGAPITFIVGGLATLASGYAMQKNSLGLFKQNGNKEVVPAEKKHTAKSDYGFIFVLGLILGAASLVLFHFFPDELSSKLSVLTNLNGKSLLVGMLFFSALVSWPISNLVNRYSFEQVFWMSALLVALSAGGIFLLPSAWMLIVMMLIFTTSFTALSVSSLPFALARAGYYEKVFCVGIFFSGVALPEGIWESLQSNIRF